MMRLEFARAPMSRRCWEHRHPVLARVLGFFRGGRVEENDRQECPSHDVEWPRDWAAEASAAARGVRLEVLAARTGLSRTHLRGIAAGERTPSARTARVIVEACEEIRGRRPGR